MWPWRQQAQETNEHSLLEETSLLVDSSSSPNGGLGNSNDGNDNQHNEILDTETPSLPPPPPPPPSLSLSSNNYGSTDSLISDFLENGISLKPTELLSVWTIVCILSTAFAYGCIFSTLFLITLPIECERIQQEHANVPKSVSLGAFVAIAGVTQLISPLIGRLSDMYVPPRNYQLGQRLPYLVLGSVCTVIGLLGQMASSFGSFWLRYGVFFFIHMTGLNIQYAMMLALIPDQIPFSQTGLANGLLAFELVTGSLFAFGLFYSVFYDYIQSMYGLYICIVILSTIATGTHGHERDATLAHYRQGQQEVRRRQSNTLQSTQSPKPQRGSMTPMEPRWRKAAKKAARKAKQVLVMTPTIILKSLLVDTVRKLDCQEFLSSYTIDTHRYHDFFVVTVSRLFYYSGMSIQTFFLYYVHDVLHVTTNAESVVAGLAILGQISAAFTCYPVGILSDRYLQGSRRPFVYLACAILFGASISLLFIRDLHQMAIVVMTLGAANGIYLTMDTSLAVDTLPDGVEDSAQLLGVWGVAAFLGSALGPMIGGPLLYIFGRNTESLDQHNDTMVEEDDKKDSYDWQGYAVVLSLGACYFLFSALILCFLRGNVQTMPQKTPARNDSD